MIDKKVAIKHNINDKFRNIEISKCAIIKF